MQEKLIVSQSAGGHAEPPEMIAAAEWRESIRARFRKATGIDLDSLSGPEIREFIELLPAASVYLLHKNDMTAIYRRESDDQTFTDR